MRILYITYGSQSGVVNTLAEQLRIKANYETHIVNILEKHNYRYNRIKFPRLSIFNVINTLSSLRQFGKGWKDGYFRTDYAFDQMSRYAATVIQNEKMYDLILQSGVIFSPPLEVIRKPYVLGILDNTYLIGKLGRRRPKGIQLSDEFVKAETETYQRADLILVMSRHVKESLVEDYKINPEKVIVTGAGPNVEPDKNYSPKEQKFRSKKIVMIAKEFKRKGGEELLSAFELIKSNHPESRLVIIGEKAKASDDRVEFRGLLGGDEIKRELEDANLYVMPSHKEPFGLALIEAMAFHTPCIGTDIEAMPEIVEDGETGFLIEPGNVTQLAERIGYILGNPKLAQAMGNAGFERYRNNFSWEVVTSKVLRHFDEILKKGPTKS